MPLFRSFLGSQRSQAGGLARAAESLDVRSSARPVGGTECSLLCAAGRFRLVLWNVDGGHLGGPRVGLGAANIASEGTPRGPGEYQSREGVAHPAAPDQAGLALLKAQNQRGAVPLPRPKTPWVASLTDL